MSSLGPENRNIVLERLYGSYSPSTLQPWSRVIYRGSYRLWLSQPPKRCSKLISLETSHVRGPGSNVGTSSRVGAPARKLRKRSPRVGALRFGQPRLPPTPCLSFQTPAYKGRRARRRNYPHSSSTFSFSLPFTTIRPTLLSFRPYFLYHDPTPFFHFKPIQRQSSCIIPPSPSFWPPLPSPLPLSLFRRWHLSLPALRTCHLRRRTLSLIAVTLPRWWEPLNSAYIYACSQSMSTYLISVHF